MRDAVKLTGMVLKAAPAGEYDKRLVLLTRERGKVTAFARGARRPGNMLMGPSRPFAFGQFQLYEGRDAYNLQSAEISNYFDNITMDMEQTCYGQYFLEFTDYYARENLDGSTLLLLLYQTLRALAKPQIPNALIRRIFELRAMVENGEYTEHPPRQVSDSANYTWEFVIASPIESLYTFNVTDPVLVEFQQCVKINKARYVDRDFHSLEILKTLVN